MKIIEITTIDSIRQTIVYDLTKHKLYTRLPSTRQDDFYTFLKTYHLPIDYAIIEFNQPYRNTLYALYPEIKICISKRAVQELFLQTTQIGEELYEEVAVTAEELEEDFYLYTHSFIQAFYKQDSKEEAIKLYHEWTSRMPLGVPYLYRLIRIIEFYKEEILNYFDLNFNIYNYK